MKKFICLLCMICCLCGCSSSSTLPSVNGDEVLSKVDDYLTAEIYQRDDNVGYMLKYGDDWYTLHWESSEHGHLRCNDERVVEIVEAFDMEVSDTYADFAYSSDVVSIYVNDLTDEGITILEYNFTEDKFTVFIDGDHEVTDEFDQALRSTKIIDYLTEDMNTIKSGLESQGTTLNEVMALNYKDIENYINK